MPRLREKLETSP